MTEAAVAPDPAIKVMPGWRPTNRWAGPVTKGCAIWNYLPGTPRRATPATRPSTDVGGRPLTDPGTTTQTLREGDLPKRRPRGMPEKSWSGYTMKLGTSFTL